LARDIGPLTMDSDPKTDPVIENKPAPEGESSSRPYWNAWGAMLRSQRLDGITAWLLEAGRPLALLSAQLLYMGVPFLGPRALGLAQLLENDDEAAGFADNLLSNRGGDAGTDRGKR
jgi:hypothetical protein